MAYKEFPIAKLHDRLELNVETGKLFWKARPVSMFRNGGHSAEHNAAKWNARYAGQEAFTIDDGRGYLSGTFMGTQLFAHRVVYAMYHGSWPDSDIDHVDHNRTNNRPDNLREADASINCKNQSRTLRNTSGVCGVTWDKSRGKWHASIRVDGQMINLGRYVNIEDAAAVRAEAEARYGFHQNHGLTAEQIHSAAAIA